MITAAFVLDVDDTLYLERDYVRSGLVAVGDHLRQIRGTEGFTELAWSLFTSGVRGRIFDEALTALGERADPALITSLVRVYRQHSPSIRLLPDADAFLAWAADNGAQLAVVTDGPPDSQRRKVAALGLSGRADPLVVTAERGVDWHKPSTRPFLHVQAALGLASRSLTYIGDNPAKDFAGPSQLGWSTVRIRRAGSLHEALASGADVSLEIRSLAELAAIYAGIDA